MLTFNRPATGSLWRDEVLNISYRVIGVDGDEALVHCHSGNNDWTDVMHLSLFNTEITEIV